MIKKIVFILALLLSTTVLAETKPYPDKWKEFTTFDDLQNIYWAKIYKFTNSEDEGEVLERVKWHNPFFTEQEIHEYCNLQVPSVSYVTKPSHSQYLKTSSELQQLCEYERNLLRLENDIDFQNWAGATFANDSLADSPFDILQDLNELEEALFGEKFTEQKFNPPLYSLYNKDQETLLPDPEKWQDGREETLQYLLKSRKYKEEDTSLTGNLAGLQETFDVLLSQSLVGGKATEQDKESATTSTVSGGDYGAELSIQAIPAPNNTPPEAESLGTPWQDMVGRIGELLKNMGFFAKSDQGGRDISDVLFLSESDYERKKVIDDGLLRDWENEEVKAEIQKSQRALKTRLEAWNQDIVSTLEGYIDLRKILETFLSEKPAR